LGEQRHRALVVEQSERGSLDHLEMMQFQGLDGELADGLHRGQHLGLRFPRNAEDQMDADFEAVFGVQSADGVDTIGKAVVAVEQPEAPVVGRLQPQFDQTGFAAGAHQLAQSGGKISGDGVGAGGKDQAPAVRVGKDLSEQGDKPDGGESRGCFLLKIR
jgi:hypothetical protein